MDKQTTCQFAWRRFLSFFMALALILALVPASVLSANAAAPSTLYMVPNSNWKQGGARFAAYFFNNNGNTWVSMTDTNSDGVYEVAVPAAFASGTVILK